MLGGFYDFDLTDNQRRGRRNLLMARVQGPGTAVSLWILGLTGLFMSGRNLSQINLCAA